MVICMSKTIKEERLRWVLPIARREVRLKDSAAVFPHGTRTLERWVAAYKKDGEDALEPRSTRPKSSPRETPIRLKEEIIALRKKKRVCALKLHWKLERSGVHINERTIGKILRAEGLVRKYRTKKVTYKYIRAALKPGELIEIDVKHVPGIVAGKRYFQYTAIDCASRWRYLKIFDEESTHHTLLFFKEIEKRFPHRITGLKTDNHATFTNRYIGLCYDMTVKSVHALDQYCAQQGVAHYLIDPGKPAQNGTVERSHRSDQETLYNSAVFTSARDLRAKVRQWNIQYNDLEHCGLSGKTPNEALALFINNPPYVCA